MLQPAFFPHVFGPNSDQPLDAEIVRAKFGALSAEIDEASGRRMSTSEIAEGFLTVAVQNMAAAMKKISIERGHDVGGYALVCFGGAGGQHACAVADAIGIKRIMIHPLAGVLSAYGLGLAEQRLLRHKSIEQELSAALLPVLADAFEALERETLCQVRDAASTSITRVRRLLFHEADATGTKPGKIIGNVAVKVGEDKDVTVPLMSDVKTGSKLILMLHEESNGDTKFDAKDKPVMTDGKMVMQAITVQ